MKHKTVLLKGAMYVRRTVGLSNGPRDRVDISKKLFLLSSAVIFTSIVDCEIGTIVPKCLSRPPSLLVESHRFRFRVLVQNSFDF